MAHHCMTPKLTHWGIFVTLDKHAMLILVTQIGDLDTQETCLPNVVSDPCLVHL